MSVGLLELSITSGLCMSSLGHMSPSLLQKVKLGIRPRPPKPRPQKAAAQEKAPAVTRPIARENEEDEDEERVAWIRAALPGWLVSMLTHVIVLLALALLTLTPPEKPKDEGLVVSTTEPEMETEEILDDIELEPEETELEENFEPADIPDVTAVEVTAPGALGDAPEIESIDTSLAELPLPDAGEWEEFGEGETGVGKELVAEAVHEHSPRCTGPLVILDCGSIPANLFESELFGHEKGAFTGALQSRAGAFERAHGGTVFLDEIGELPIELQPKLLRVLETKQVQRIGGIKRVACDVRVVAATNRDLEVEVNRGSFRADLYYRLDVARLHVPPLRERVEDIPLLIARFVDDLPHRRDGGLPADLAARLAEQAWPGNVRQLRNAVERALLLPSHPIEVESPAAARGSRTLADHIDIEVPFKEAKRRLVDEFDALYIEALLDAHDGNISAAARSAQVDRMTIYKLMDRLGRKR